VPQRLVLRLPGTDRTVGLRCCATYREPLSAPTSRQANMALGLPKREAKHCAPTVRRLLTRTPAATTAPHDHHGATHRRGDTLAPNAALAKTPVLLAACQCVGVAVFQVARTHGFAALPDLARFENPADLMGGRRGQLNGHAPSSRLEDLVAGVRSATSTLNAERQTRARRRRPAAHPLRAEDRRGA
jgi:hypothetical protein